MRLKALLPLALMWLPAFASAAIAQDFPDGAYRSITVAALGGTEVITLPVRQDEQGDDEVLIPDHGWVRCVYRDCEYTVRKHHFDFWEGDRTGQGIGRGILGDLIGLD